MPIATDDITERASTRVHAAPYAQSNNARHTGTLLRGHVLDAHRSGGRQQFNLFSGEEEPAAKPAAKPTAAPAAPAVNAADAPVAGQRVQVRDEHSGISERSSSRVLAAPGGRQQFNIFSGEEEPAKPATKPAAAAAAPAAPAADAPVAGQRVEVRDEHMGMGERRSSRVLAAPGGRQQINIFGGPEEAEPVEKPAKVAKVDAGPAAMPAVPEMRAAGCTRPNRSEFDGISDGRMSSRVLAAPGGASSLGTSAADRIAAMKARRETTAAPLVESADVKANSQTMFHGDRPF